jgi:hypothetical protein
LDQERERERESEREHLQFSRRRDGGISSSGRFELPSISGCSCLAASLADREEEEEEEEEEGLFNAFRICCDTSGCPQ